ncbi:MAG: hypothetical protein U0903_04355 [Planctomycetales bacterium]
MSAPYPQQTPRGSGCFRYILIIMALLGVLSLALCLALGGLAWWGVSQFHPSFDPKVGREVAQGIADIDIPPELVARMSMHADKLGIRMVIFAGDNETEGLVLTQFRDPKTSGNAPDVKQSFESTSEKDFDITESTDKEFTIRGAKTKFTFAKGKNKKNNQDARLVHGKFTGKDGNADFVYFTPADKYDEARVIKIIESIK